MPSPRDIPEVKESVSKLKFDKLWVKYYPQEEAYDTARQWFLDSDYTHLIIHPDDLIVKQEHLDKLVAYDNDTIISGWCTNTMRPEEYDGLDSSFSYKIMAQFIGPHTAHYEDYELVPVKYIPKDSIVKVGFVGFTPTIIPKPVLELIKFRTDFDCCPDATFAVDLNNNGFSQYVDTSVQTHHLRVSRDLIQTGKKDKLLYLDKAEKE